MTYCKADQCDKLHSKNFIQQLGLGSCLYTKQLGAVRSKIYRINKHRFRCILTKGNVRIHRVRYIKCFQKKKLLCNMHHIIHNQC